MLMIMMMALTIMLVLIDDDDDSIDDDNNFRNYCLPYLSSLGIGIGFFLYSSHFACHLACFSSQVLELSMEETATCIKKENRKNRIKPDHSETSPKKVEKHTFEKPESCKSLRSLALAK